MVARVSAGLHVTSLMVALLLVLVSLEHSHRLLEAFHVGRIGFGTVGGVESQQVVLWNKDRISVRFL